MASTSRSSSTRPRWFPIVAVVLSGLLLGLLIVNVLACNDAGPTRSSPAGGALPAARADSHIIDSAGPDAPTLVEFLDFECEACSALHPVVQDVREHYRGKINYVLRHFPLSGHPNAVPAALAVEAAAQQGQVEAMADVLLETQAQWSGRPDSQAPLFRTYAERLGLDMARYDADVADPATLARVQQDYADGEKLGIQGTPTFIVDGKVLTLNKLSDLTDPIDEALAAAPRR